MDRNITVLASAESDIPSILEIETDSQPEPWTENSFREELGRASLFVARLSADASSPCPVSADIAGFICFWSVCDEVQILNIAVRKSMRGKGVARALLDFAIQTGQRRRARVATLEVRKSNLAARGLYESMGFRIIGKRPGYYGVRTESAILMELEIP